MAAGRENFIFFHCPLDGVRFTREDCAHLLDPGEVHDGPPRRTHSIGDLIQRKEQCSSQIVPVDIISDLSFERRFSAINSPASGFN